MSITGVRVGERGGLQDRCLTYICGSVSGGVVGRLVRNFISGRGRIYYLNSVTYTNLTPQTLPVPCLDSKIAGGSGREVQTTVSHLGVYAR